MIFSRLLSPDADASGGLTASDVDTVGDVETTQAASSMEETIRAKWRELSAADGGDQGAATESRTDEREPHTDERQNAQKAERVRGPDGRFVSSPRESRDAERTADRKDGEKKGGEQGLESNDGKEGQRPADEKLASKPHDAFPNTWRRELQAEWTKLPESVRAEIHRREADFHRGIAQYRDAASFGQQMAEVLLPYQRIMQERGVHPVAIVRDIMGALNTMATGTDEQKARVFLQLAENYGINLDAVQSLRQRAPGGVAPELSPVLQRIQQLESILLQQQQQQEERERAEDEAAVQRFLNDPKNEFAREVTREMAALLQSGEATDLQDAYDKAIWINPQVRATLLERQEQERKKREAEEVAAARKAAEVNVERRGTPPAPKKPGTMEDTIRAEYRRLMGSG